MSKKEISEEISQIFHQIQTEGQVLNKHIVKVVEFYSDNRLRVKVISDLQQCYMKIMKQLKVLKTVSRRTIDNYIKFTERLFSKLFKQSILNDSKDPLQAEENIMNGSQEDENLQDENQLSSSEVVSIF